MYLPIIAQGPVYQQGLFCQPGGEYAITIDRLCFRAFETVFLRIFRTGMQIKGSDNKSNKKNIETERDAKENLPKIVFENLVMLCENSAEYFHLKGMQFEAQVFKNKKKSLEEKYGSSKNPVKTQIST